MEQEPDFQSSFEFGQDGGQMYFEEEDDVPESSAVTEKTCFLNPISWAWWHLLSRWDLGHGNPAQLYKPGEVMEDSPWKTKLFALRNCRFLITSGSLMVTSAAQGDTPIIAHASVFWISCSFMYNALQNYSNSWTTRSYVQSLMPFLDYCNGL